MAKILLAGEQVTAYGVEIKGFNFFGVSAWKEDGHALVAALVKSGHAVDWMRTAHVPVEFPETMRRLKCYDAVILSDVGADSLWFHPEMVTKSVPHPRPPAAAPRLRPSRRRAGDDRRMDVLCGHRGQGQIPRYFT